MAGSLSLAFGCALLAVAVAAQGVAVPAEVQAILDAECVDCHGGREPEAGLDLSALPARPLPAALLTLLELRERVAARVMPPPAAGEISDEQVGRLVRWANATLDARGSALVEPATPVPARRLDRAQYRRAVWDLFGVTVPAAAEFPAEDLAFGFATTADALRFSAVHVEKYLAAAEEVAAAVVATASARRWQIEDAVGESKGVAVDGDFANFYTTATVRITLPELAAGSYRLRVRAFGDQAGDAPPRLDVAVDAARVARFDVVATRRAPQEYRTEVELKSGARTLWLSFGNDFYAPDHPDPERRDRNLHLDWVELEGPLGQAPGPAGSQWWLRRDPGGASAEARLRALLPALLERAWRAPVGDEELRFVLQAALGGEGRAWPQPLRRALVAVLASPRFVLRLEAPAPDPRRRAYELAARLSFLAWGSVPDAALLDLARAGTLSDDATFAAEVTRLLRDARSSALATEFAAQWLELPSLQGIAFDPARFGDVGPELLRSMRRETELLFEAVLREGRPVRELLTADFSFYDRRLARHYGVEGDFDEELRRVAVSDPRRRGLLGHASILALTSNPTRTSPVKRGKWILDNLLGAPPAPPPPGNGAFPADAVVDTAASLREQLARHRRDDACAVCHERMDALGLALEGFDAVGRLRRRDGGTPVDTSAVLPGGRRIDGSVELCEVLAADGALAHSLAQKLFLFAVGRPPTAGERVALDVRARALPLDVTLADLVRVVLDTQAFRQR